MKKSLFSLLIVLVMVITMTGSALGDFAKEDSASGADNDKGSVYDEIVDAEDEGLSTTANDGAHVSSVVEGNIEANTGGASVISNDTDNNISGCETEASVEVQKDVIVDDTKGNESAYGINAESNASNSVNETPAKSETNVAVGGNVSVEGNKDVDGLYTKAESDASEGSAILTTTVGGNITVTGHELTQSDNETTGVTVIAYAAGATSAENTFTSEGSVTVTSEGKGTGIATETTVASDEGATARTSVSVDGSVSVSADDAAFGIDATASSESENVKPVNEITVGGDVTAAATDTYGTAIGVDFSDNYNAEQTIKITGTVSATSDKSYAKGITATGDSSDEEFVTNSDVTISAKGVEATSGLYAVGVQTNSAGGTAKIDIGEGGVLADGAACSHGIESIVKEGNTTRITVAGDVISLSEQTHNNGLYAAASDKSEISMKVDGGIIAAAAEETASDDNGYVVGIDASGHGGSIIDIHTGSVIADGGDKGTGVMLYEENSFIKLEVQGDVSGSATGLYLSAGNVKAADTPGGHIEVVVTGTISGGKNAIVLDDDRDNVRGITVYTWKIDTEKVGCPAVRYEKSSGETKNDEDFTRNGILYLIKVEQPAEGGTLGVTDENGNSLAPNYGYEAAKEGTKLLLKVNVADGYDLKNAYNGYGEKVPLRTNDNGDFFVEVPRGGGVYLTAEFCKREDEPIEMPKDESAAHAAKPVEKPKDNTRVDPVGKPGEDEPADIATKPAAVYTPAEQILTIRNTNSKVKIDFYKDGTYIAYMENGSTDKGTYKLVDGVLVLTNDHQEKFMFKLDKGVYILNYAGYLFEIGHHDYNKAL